MMTKITRGKGFLGLCRYVLSDKKSPSVIGGNLSSSTANELALQLRSVASLRADVSKPVWHGSLRLPPGDTLTPDMWDLISDEYLVGLGFDLAKTPHVKVFHDDHLHIVISRVDIFGGLYLGKNEHLIATKLAHELEKKYGLTITKSPDYDEAGRIIMPDRSKPRSGEVKMKSRTEMPLPRDIIRSAIDKHIQDKPTAEELVLRLAVEGIEAKPNLATTGKMSGFSFSIDGFAFGGSKLGKAYGWQGLQARGLDMAADRSARWDHRRKTINRLIATGNIQAESGSKAVTYYFLGKEVLRLLTNPEILPTEQIEKYINGLNHAELKQEKLRLRKINQRDKSRGARTRSI